MPPPRSAVGGPPRTLRRDHQQRRQRRVSAVDARFHVDALGGFEINIHGDLRRLALGRRGAQPRLVRTSHLQHRRAERRGEPIRVLQRKAGDARVRLRYGHQRRMIAARPRLRQDVPTFPDDADADALVVARQHGEARRNQPVGRGAAIEQRQTRNGPAVHRNGAFAWLPTPQRERASRGRSPAANARSTRRIQQPRRRFAVSGGAGAVFSDAVPSANVRGDALSQIGHVGEALTAP